MLQHSLYPTALVGSLVGSFISVKLMPYAGMAEQSTTVSNLDSRGKHSIPGWFSCSSILFCLCTAGLSFFCIGFAKMMRVTRRTETSLTSETGLENHSTEPREQAAWECSEGTEREWLQPTKRGNNVSHNCANHCARLSFRLMRISMG